MKFLGAKVILTPKELKGTGMTAKALELSKKHGFFYTTQFANPANPAYHRQTTASEILLDFTGRKLDYFVSGWVFTSKNILGNLLKYRVQVGQSLVFHRC